MDVQTSSLTQRMVRALRLALSGTGETKSTEPKTYPNEKGSISSSFLTAESASAYLRTGQTPDLKRSITTEVSNYDLARATVSAWCYSDINLISSRVSAESAVPQVFEDIGSSWELLHSHPFERLLRRPNGLMTRSYMLKYLAWWYLLVGNSYGFVVTEKLASGEPLEIIPLPGQLVRPLPATRHLSRVDGLGEVVDFEYTPDGSSSAEVLPGEHVLHFRTPNPFDWWVGLAPLAAANLGITLDRHQAKWASDFFGEDNAVPTNIISLPADLDEVAYETAKTQIRNEFGVTKKSAVVRAGDMTVQTISQTLEQLQIVALRSFSRDEIDRVYGIPEGLMAGAISGDSRSSAEVGFSRNTIQPLLDYFAEEFGRILLPFYRMSGLGYEKWYAIRAQNIVPADRALDIQEMGIYGRYRSVNENRKLLGLPPDQNPISNTPLVVLELNTRTPGTSTPGLGGPQNLDPKVGTMLGASSPDAVAASLSEEKSLPGRTIALLAELEKWEKVATKDPSRTFRTEILPAHLHHQVMKSLSGLTSAPLVHEVFDVARQSVLDEDRELDRAASTAMLKAAQELRMARAILDGQSG